MSVSPAHIARLSGSGGYCSGTLISPDEVLTCAHFFAERGAGAAGLRIEVAGKRPRAKEVRIAPRTDVALVRLESPVYLDLYPSFGRPRWMAETVTFGFGGRAAHPVARVGRYVGALPLAVSRGLRTWVRPAGFTFNTSPVIKGDSGGPVLIDAHVVAVQSLILDPRGTNLRVATVSLVGPELLARLR